jgi:transposase
VFSEFLTSLILMAVEQGNHTIHLILDNGSTHRPKALQAWLDAWKVEQGLENVTINVHRLPVRSSWLNQIEIFFGQLQSFILTPNNYPSVDALKERILQFIDFWNLYARPIEWTYTVADLQHQFARTPDTPDPRLGRVTKKRSRTRTRAGTKPGAVAA